MGLETLEVPILKVKNFAIMMVN